MRKQDAPLICPDCRKTFRTPGNLKHHRKHKHAVKVHSFGELADSLKARQEPVAASTAAKAKKGGSAILWIILAVLGLLAASGAVVFLSQ